MTLITGGAKCGKSKLAEKLLDSFQGNKIYIATMLPYGDEAEAAIKRHRKLR
ncbi:MAG: bifunctional adenosylcobinamide kinase/adenosylcobinamide-phosphate guanylyltransferase, partial [Ruminococcus sp.]